MMELVRTYILSVTAAALLCGILRSLFPDKGIPSSLLKLVSGIFLAFTVIAPVKQIEVRDISDCLASFTVQGESLAEDGKNLSADALADIIKVQTEAYILDKAESLSLSVSVEVGVDTGEIPQPDSARIIGSVSPYAKEVLGTVMEKELGIAREDQIWID